MRCVVLNGKRIILYASILVLILVIVLVAAVYCNKSQEVFFDTKMPIKIIEKELSIEQKNINVDIIEQNPLINKPDPTPAPVLTPTPTEEIITPLPIEEKNSYGKMEVRNESGYDVDLEEYASKALPFELSYSDTEVLIMHTHTTESYSSSDITKYLASENGRTTNDQKNMIAIGKIIADTLNQNGIKTIHNTTVHDYPTYNKAYTRAAATITNLKKQHPNIKIVLDIHRDAIGDDKSFKLTTDISGEKAAQVMIVTGTDKNGLAHENWKKNLIFASHLQKNANTMYPGLMRNLNLRAERFNQHLTQGSLIIEIGSNTNTLEEAKLSAKVFSEVIIKTLRP